MNKEAYFKALDENQAGMMPTTDEEIEWFEEWCAQTKKGQEFTREVDENLKKMHSKAYIEQFFTKAYLRTQQEEGIETLTVRFKEIKGRMVAEITPIPVRPYKEKYTSHEIWL